MADHQATENEAKTETSPKVILNRPRLSYGEGDVHPYITPTHSPNSEHHFLVPSPMVTRRTRTYSASRRATEGPSHIGKCKFFSRSKGHGFIFPDDEPSSEPIFMHVSDIESEYVPLPGDVLSYKLTRIPPKNEKFQAVEVRIISLCTDDSQRHHERWDSAPSHE